MTNISETSRFLIIGTGGIGGYFGGLLAKHGYNVTFLARGDHFTAMKSNGLIVKSVKEDFIVNPIKVVNDLEGVEIPDIVLICVKTYDTEEVANSLRGLIDDNVIIISIQNGIENDSAIKTVIPNCQVYPGLAHIISARTAPGTIVQKGGPRTLIFGDRSGTKNASLLEIAKLMRLAGIDAACSENIMVDMWEKFAFIVAFSGFTALGRCHIGKIINNRSFYDLFKKGMFEAIEVAKASGIKLPDTIYENVINRTEKYRGAEEGATSSLLRDLQAGNRNEIETLSGSIVRMADQIGVDAPIHKLIYMGISLASK